MSKKIIVETKLEYDAVQSHPSADEFIFKLTATIINRTGNPIKLLTRLGTIFDSNLEAVTMVSSSYQPVIKRIHEHHHYLLSHTELGLLIETYVFQTPDEIIEVEVPTKNIVYPGKLN